MRRLEAERFPIFSRNLRAEELVIVAKIKAPMAQIAGQTARNIAELSETDNQAITVQSVTHVVSACSEAFTAAHTKV